MEENDEINVKQLFKNIWRRKWILIIITLVSILAGYMYTMNFVTPVYEATTTLVLASKDNSLNSNLVATYKELVKSDNIVQTVVTELRQKGIEVSADEIKNNISVSSSTGTQILKVSCKNKEPEYAKLIADETSKAFIESVSKLYKIENLTIYSEAQVPTKPSNVNHRKDMEIFAIGGIVLSFVIIFIVNIFDTTIKSKDELESEFDLYVLSTIPIYETQMQKIDNKRQNV